MTPRSTSTNVPSRDITPERSAGLPPGSVQHWAQWSYKDYYEQLHSENGFGNWHDCRHYKKLVRPHGAYTYYWGTSANWRYAYTQPVDVEPAKASLFSPLPDLGQESVTEPWASGYTPPDLQTLLDWGFQSMVPGIKPKVSLINSIIELKDFKFLFRGLRRGRVLKQLMDSMRFRTLSDIIRSSSSAYLIKEFAVDPLVSDICGVYSSLKAFRAQLERLYRGELRTLVTHWRIPLGNNLPDREDVVGPTNLASEAFGGHMHRRTVAYSQRDFVVTIEYRYRLRALPPAVMEVNALLDALGVQLNPAIAWNAIPFSFLFDWVVGVSRFLDRFGVSNTMSQVEICRACWSTDVKRITKYEIWASKTYPGTSYIPTWTIEEEAYNRQTFAPSWFGVITTSGINLNEFILGSALVGANLRRR